MKKEFRKLSKAEQKRTELEYHRAKPEAFDKVMAEANRSRLLEAIVDVEQDRNIVMPDQEQFK